MNYYSAKDTIIKNRIFNLCSRSKSPSRMRTENQKEKKKKRKKECSQRCFSLSPEAIGAGTILFPK